MDLALCCRIIKACDSASSNPRDWGVSFICGRAGVCALGAVAASYANDSASLNCYLDQFKKIKLPKNVPDELLYGRAGAIWGLVYSFLNKHINKGTISASTMNTVKDEIFWSGKKLGKKAGSPLMFEWERD
ncbi:hypothetical protein MLD38_003087 [Melastoma candidum]|uniref:Uncharacterized protein n=1 Tax=Melastoma candidum TaxID=119954 RepID=A0ACB9S1P2_9MYRT|nr:hypothetical protein MLD38_003087 [Melastoma candidum]